MKLKNFSDFKESQYGVINNSDTISIAPLSMTPNNYFCNYNNYKIYDLYQSNLKFTIEKLNDYFIPFNHFNCIEYNSDKNEFVSYPIVYKRRDIDYYIVIDRENYIDDDRVIHMDKEVLFSCIYYDSSDQEECIKINEDLNMLFKDYKRNHGKKIEIIIKTMAGFSFKSHTVKNFDLNISENYNDDFLPVYDSIVDKLNNQNNGIILLHGLAGTGKTNLIRHLTTIIEDKKFIFIPNNLIPSLADPSFLGTLIDNKNSVLVLEDSEVFLKDRDTSGENSVVSTILNLSDGLLSDILGIQIICTFNADLGKVDEALLREGRLIAEYEFNKLSLEKSNILANKLGFGNVDKEMSLAEIYNLKNKAHRKQNKKSKIGF